MDFDTPKIKFYKFFFNGKPKPIIMEAYNRAEADEMLKLLNQKTNVIDMSNLIDVRIESPVKGVSKRKRKGLDFIWVGKELSEDGWMLEEDFNNQTNQDE
jgi:hypothetical protein